MISVIIPVYNEEGNIPELTLRVTASLERLDRAYEVIVVDDGSRDATWEELLAATARYPKLKAIQLRRNYGQTAAMTAGFSHARGDILIAMDGDLQTDPDDIGKLLDKLEEGYDVVSGWRADRKDDAVRRNLPSVLANRLITRSTGVKLHDFGCSLKAYRREILQHVHLYGEMHRFIAVYCVIAGARLAEVPVRHYARRHGKSKYGLERTVKVVCDLCVVLFLQRFAQKPMYLFGSCGLLGFAGSAVSFLAAFYYKFLGGKSFVQTPLPLIGGVLFVSGVICFLMGLLAELLIRVYHESQKKPTYIVHSVSHGIEESCVESAVS